MRVRAFLLCAAVQFVAAAQQPAWYQVPIDEPHPPARNYPALAYDENLQQVVLFGGCADTGCLNDTWIWDGRWWKQVFPSVSPQRLYAPQMVYDAFNRQVVLVGSEFVNSQWASHTWLWDGLSGTWTEVLPAHHPDSYLDVAMVFDEASAKTMLFTGAVGDGQPSNRVWIWNGADWTERVAGAGEPWPAPRCRPRLAYDRQRSKVVLFGGWDGGWNWMNDTWTWNGIGWTRETPAASPGADGSYAVAADNNRSSVLALGPLETSSTLATWKWDGSNWTNLTPATAPPPSRLSLSETAGGVLAVGGSLNGMADTWFWGQANIVFNKAPVANAGLVQSVACTSTAGATVTLDGSASYDPEGSPLTYTWTGPFGAAYGAKPTVELPVGVSTVSLTVSDGTLTGAGTVAVAVYAAVSGLSAPLGPLALQPALPPVPENAFNVGRTLPLKLALSCGGQPVTAVAPPTLTSVIRVGDSTQPVLSDAGTSATRDVGPQFRLADDSTWIYNFDTTGLTSGLYLVAIQTPGSRTYQAYIALR